MIETPAVLNADEEACFRSLSFAELYARESNIEPAIQDTGSWLLERQNFQDWIQRKKLDEHRGFFWIQGNPGSGKSTLMKKVYSHVTACPQDPSSIIAAFFFNARGNEIEKSPTGLLRTLLHTLCQQISALRGLVVKTYVEKRRILNPGWQWQLSELKGLLAAAVTSSVLGQRRLLLFVDALDECDLTATQSVIQMFEDVASSSLSEGTNFNICLSSRYWPQFRIQHCFFARVELENKDDIIRYIQKHLEPTPIQEEDLEPLNALKIEILEKAKGTFLWVVLVTQDLLNANAGGATLSELRNIVQRVPPDLSQFYQHQLQITKSGDRERMLRLLQLVFYAQRPLSPIELRYALAFGSRAYASYAEWSQSSEYVRSDEQMEKRIREHSKGLVEIAPLPEDDKYAQDSVRSRKAVVQFIHQSVRDFLTANGFSFLRHSRRCTERADGHEFIKKACFNYLRIKDLEAMLEVDFRVNAQFDLRLQFSNLVPNHPLLEYMARYIFEHAAKAKAHGVPQDGFIAYMYNNTQRCFERWRFIADLRYKDDYSRTSPGSETRPITNLAKYGLITREIAEKEKNIDKGGRFRFSALDAACSGGHQNAVQILLEFGAAPGLDGTSPERSTIWGTTTLAPFHTAVRKQQLPVLRQLLTDHRSCLTLQERLNLAGFLIDWEPCSKAILDLLIPEATFPDSAIYDVCLSARYSLLEHFSFLLDKSQASIVHEEILWHDALRQSYPYHVGMSKIRALLDRGGTVKITATLLECLQVDVGDFSAHGSKDASKVLSLLLEHCEAEMTEDLIDSMCHFEDSLKIVRTFEAAGHRFDPFTPQRLLTALRSGTAESAAFFLQNSNGNPSVDEMLESALSNHYNGEEVTRLLLGYLNPDQIYEQAIIAAVSNDICGGDLIRLLHSRWSSLKFSEAALTIAVRLLCLEDIEFILERCEVVRVTEEILTGALSEDAEERDSEEERFADKFNLLLLHDPDIIVQVSTVIAALRNLSRSVEILKVFCRHGKSLPCTESVVAAAIDCFDGPAALKIVLEQNRGALISSSKIMMATQEKRGAALISVMLDHDHTIVINEEHLIAAASNRYDPSTIFEFLQTKGKLGNIDLASEVLHNGAAKRRKISHKSSPRISRRVINAAFSNLGGGAKHRLLRLFLEWGVITETDYNDRTCNIHSRSRTLFPHPSNFTALPRNLDIRAATINKEKRRSSLLAIPIQPLIIARIDTRILSPRGGGAGAGDSSCPPRSSTITHPLFAQRPCANRSLIKGLGRTLTLRTAED